VEGWPALRTETKWFAGWVRKYFWEEVASANKWAAATRTLYSAGIFLFLSGLAAVAVPPASEQGFWRWVIFGIAAVGAAGELIWIALNSKWGQGLVERWRAHGKPAKTSQQDGPARTDG